MTRRPVVIDANFAAKIVLPNPMREVCCNAMGYLIRKGYDPVAPTLWAYEVTSAVCKAIHFGYLTEDEGEQSLHQLLCLNVMLKSPQIEDNYRAMMWTRKLKRAATYDSFYLALAETLGCELWTADQRLINSVNVPWVRWVGDL
ncbi:MAG TPA: type II toxin-antitoxin system VapC family toxin [Anaerolineae bacterium]|nr:type II toxin-antitoxin system VapC family toxin [Anaerolineae bacterium]HQK14726.1 type II toxin-antitoxin system VapC family toxin [Anaerolineae bacterium]